MKLHWAALIGMVVAIVVDIVVVLAISQFWKIPSGASFVLGLFIGFTFVSLSIRYLSEDFR